VRIAVIGAGISGLMCSWLLSRKHRVSLFEANDYLGGHTDTHDIELDGRHYRVDTGFIVYSPLHYPLLTRLFGELRVESQPTTMSFSVRNEATGLEYNATNLAGMFCQRRNLVSPRFLGMIRDLMRFYREAPTLLDHDRPGPTLENTCAKAGSAPRFATTIWSPWPARSGPPRPKRYYRSRPAISCSSWQIIRCSMCRAVPFGGWLPGGIRYLCRPRCGHAGRSRSVPAVRSGGLCEVRSRCRSRPTRVPRRSIRWCLPVTAIRHCRCSMTPRPASVRCSVPCAIR